LSLDYNKLIIKNKLRFKNLKPSTKFIIKIEKQSKIKKFRFKWKSKIIGNYKKSIHNIKLKFLELSCEKSKKISMKLIEEMNHIIETDLGLKFHWERKIRSQRLSKKTRNYILIELKLRCWNPKN
jgi:hypothetical protein